MTVGKLLSPFPLAGATLRNRIAMAPMTREMSPNGVPGADIAAYYARRAAGGTGLIITEGVAVDRTGSFGINVPRLYGADALAGWRNVVDSVHAEGAAIMAQLWHVGAFCPSLIGMDVSLPADLERVSPSALAAPGRAMGRAMSTRDIDEAIAAFVRATENAKATGFDGIELHAAHGYLIDQFLWRETNLRTDGFGGAPAARLTFPIELIRAVRAAAGPDFILAIRLSQWKQLDYAARLAETPAELEALLRPLAEAGVDLFHCSTRRFWEPAFAGDPRTLAGWMRRLSGKPVITVGSVTLATDFKAPGGKVHADAMPLHLTTLERGLSEGEWDLIAIGRALIANPDWVRLVAAGEERHLRDFDKAMLESLH